MKKAVILYWHGIGDIIILTPVLRYLYSQGYLVDIMCHKQIKSSRLLDHCPYIGKLIIIENPWWSDLGFETQKELNHDLLLELSTSYDWSAQCVHDSIVQDCKIATNWHECNLVPGNNRLEVFINDETEKRALAYIENNYPSGYIFQHTYVTLHETHNWDSTDWIKTHLPDLPIIDTGQNGDHYCCDQDINFSFVLAREARHRVLSSSVFVHACDAMNVKIDVINYGRPDHKVWPKDGSKVLRIREKERWIK